MYQWTELKEEFEADGSLRDVYIENTNSVKWNEFLDFIKLSKYQLEFKHGGKLLNVPDTFSSIKELQETNSTILSIKLNGNLCLNCHFFIETEIELDLAPCDVRGESDFKVLLEFLESLSSSLACKVALTPENTPMQVILSFGDEFV
ncbi:hypothetical protein [Photobacterium sp. 53610]|uniref:hypothetical protein n=1 Tax=Photobacterium sp. 53610 TaxID=3102789 RepID=UPI002ED9C6A2